MGSPIRSVRRVGFRIESIVLLNQQNEILIFEILTSGRISPQRALRESALLLEYKFSTIANVTLPLLFEDLRVKTKEEISRVRKRFGSYSIENEFSPGTSDQTFCEFFNNGFFRLREPLGLELGNLDLTKESYAEMRRFGFQTLGQFLERLAFESNTLSPILKTQRYRALFRLGFFPPLI
jgi:DNA-directed RNA polymerase alpha subunit